MKHMTINRYTSDWHFNHTFVAGTRGFESSEAHDADLLDAINSVTHKNDNLWVMGDLFMGSITEGLKKVAQVNGRKHLVLGNHDGGHPLHRGSHNKLRRYLEVFETVSLHEQHRFGKHKVMLSHFPYGSKYSHVTAGPEWRETDASGYYANRDGKIRGRFGRVLKPWVAGSGYLYVSVSDKGNGVKHRTVHSLVCAAFHGPRPVGMQVGHNDGNSLNNRATNLRWVTRQENAQDKHMHGTATGSKFARAGADNPKAKLDWDSVAFIRESEESVGRLALTFGVSTSTIRDIQNLRTWKGEVEKTTGDHADREDRYVEWRLPDTGNWLIHGHVHDEWFTNGRQINVGVDQSFTPFTQTEISDIIEA